MQTNQRPRPLQDGLAELILDCKKWHTYFFGLRLLGKL